MSATENMAVFAVSLDTVWVIIAAVLVFMMNAGFGMLEAGLCRAKNTVNIFAKNIVIFAIAGLSFWLVGFGLMFGDGNSLMGMTGWMLSGVDNSPAVGDYYYGDYTSLSWAALPLYAKVLFQLMFVAASAHIVSGAVTERIKFFSFIAFSIVLVAIIYPVVGHWAWGGGWLSDLGFIDFAGSSVVHSVGGWAALTGTIILGARAGKFTRDGRVSPIPGHNLAMAALGMFLLWFGWFGFNAGSAMTASSGELIATVALNTTLAAAAGVISALIAAEVLIGKPDMSMILNGALGGLVAITAGCAEVSTSGAVIIGLVSGVLVVYFIMLLDRRRIDDPVGAVPVHLVNGIWGTLAVGLFSLSEGFFYTGELSLLTTQLIGVAAIAVFAGGGSYLVWHLVSLLLGGLRVSQEEEHIGLDISEHGMEAYPSSSGPRALY
ncbi:MAG: ammonium transporter [Gammaproteobacteria bacterium]|nr:ammonium transporter [Gammaproteobacteria bacterium]